MTELIRVYFPGVQMGDIATSINGIAYPTTFPVSNLPTFNPQFYIEQDATGADILCTVKNSVGQLTGVFNIAGTVVATAIPIVEFIKGRPIGR